MTISQTQAQALATFIARIRTDWDHPGIVATILKASSLGNPASIGRALCALAENRELHSPALLSQPGRHWQQDGEPVGPNATSNTRCHRHTLSFVPCPECASENEPAPPTPEYLAEKKKLAERKTASKAIAQKRLADFETAQEATA